MEKTSPHITKFTFDTEFRPERDIVSDAARARQRKSLTQDEIEQLRAKARSEGLTAGQVRAEEETAAAVEAFGKTLRDVLGQCEADIEAMREDAVRVAFAAACKLAGGALAVCPEAEVEQVLKTAVRQATGEAHVVLRASPDVIAALSPKLAEIAREEGFNGKIGVSADPSFDGPDCRVEWHGGGIERNVGVVEAAIDDVIERRFAKKNSEASAKG